MISTQVLIVGAGPAGLAAATSAAEAGARVVVIDDNAQAGGQIHRQVPHEFGLPHASVYANRGHQLFRQATAAGVTFRFGCTAWGCFDPGIMDVVDSRGVDRIRADAVILAPGAHDRPTPLPGWTLPGVFTVGGAQALLKGQRVLPGTRMLLAGTGPLLLVVASQLCEAGVEVVAVAEPVPAWRGLTVLPALLRQWSLLGDAVRYRSTLLRHRVPWLGRTMVTRVSGTDGVTGATVAHVDDDWRPIAGSEQHFEVDAVAIGYGLVPSIELARLCGCRVEYDAATRTWLPVRDVDFESTTPGVFVVGDGAGVAGAIVAAEEGHIAGCAVARRLGTLSAEAYAQRTSPSRARLRALGRFRAVVDRAYTLRDGVFQLADHETIACRCEDVTFAELDAAIDDGARDAAALKSFTRCGMGSCQGRMCASTTADWLARRTGRPVQLMPPATIAPPAKPVITLGALGADQWTS